MKINGILYEGSESFTLNNDHLKLVELLTNRKINNKLLSLVTLAGKYHKPLYELSGWWKELYTVLAADKYGTIELKELITDIAADTWNIPSPQSINHNKSALNDLIGPTEKSNDANKQLNDKLNDLNKKREEGNKRLRELYGKLGMSEGLWDVINKFENNTANPNYNARKIAADSISQQNQRAAKLAVDILLDNISKTFNNRLVEVGIDPDEYLSYYKLMQIAGSASNLQKLAMQRRINYKRLKSILIAGSKLFQ